MNKTSKKIGFIGAGKMAQAIIKGIIKANFFTRDNIFASEPNAEARKKVEKEFGIKVFADNKTLAQTADIILFAVKPFVINDAILSIKEETTAEKTIISIAAGISTEKIQAQFGINLPVVRVMPNTPALVNEGMAAVCGGKYATSEHIEFTKELFSCLGKVIEIDESQIDIITAISGSSPAFYYYFINEIARSAERMGFDYKTALLASAQSALGSAKMILETGIPPETLIDNVTTKGGTTEVGMNILRKANLDKIVDEAIIGTKEKSEMLGK